MGVISLCIANLCSGILPLIDESDPQCCSGVIGITDDDIMHSKDDEEHDIHLHKLMKAACKHGLVFHSEKYNICDLLWMCQC